MSNKESPPGVKPVPLAAGRCRKGHGGGGEPVTGAGRDRNCCGGGEESVSGAGCGRKSDSGSEEPVLGSARGSQGDRGGVRDRGDGGRGRGIETFPSAGRGGEGDEVEPVRGSVGCWKSVGGGTGPVPGAGRHGLGDGGDVGLVPGAGRGKEGHGGAERPPLPCPRSNPLLLCPPTAATSTECPGKNCSPFKALSLVKKKESTGLLKKAPSAGGIIIREKQAAGHGSAPKMATPILSSSGSDRNLWAKDLDSIDIFRSMSAERKGSCSESSGGIRSAGTPVTELAGNEDNNSEQPDTVSTENAARLTNSKSLSANGNGRCQWGKNFLQRFGNNTARGQCSSSESLMRSAQNIIRVPGEDGPSTIPTEDLITIVVDNIDDLLNCSTELTAIEFESDIKGKVLGHLFRIAKVLGFKNFVHNDTLSRAMLHYACSYSGGLSRGHNLDDEAREALGIEG